MAEHLAERRCHGGLTLRPPPTPSTMQVKERSNALREFGSPNPAGSISAAGRRASALPRNAEARDPWLRGAVGLRASTRPASQTRSFTSTGVVPRSTDVPSVLARDGQIARERGR